MFARGDARVDVRTIGEMLAAVGTWIRATQRLDGGWGPYEGHPSRVVSTAEALLAAAVAAPNLPSASRGLAYLRQCLAGQEPALPQHQRHYAYIALAGARAGVNPADVPTVRSAVERMLEFESADGGFAAYRTGGPLVPNTFSTYLASQALRASSPFLMGASAEAATQASIRATAWLVDTRRSDGSWGLAPGEPPSASATSFALLALLEPSPHGRLPAAAHCIPAGVQYLLSALPQTRTIEREQRVDGGGVFNFSYFTTGWVVAALLRGGRRLWHAELWPEISYLASLQRGDGGWGEASDRASNVWASYAAVEALRAALESFDARRELLDVSRTIYERPASRGPTPTVTMIEERTPRGRFGWGDLVALHVGPIGIGLTVSVLLGVSLAAIVALIWYLLTPASADRTVRLGTAGVATGISAILAYTWAGRVRRESRDVTVGAFLGIPGLVLALDAVAHGIP